MTLWIARNRPVPRNRAILSENRTKPAGLDLKAAPGDPRPVKPASGDVLGHQRPPRLRGH